MNLEDFILRLARFHLYVDRAKLEIRIEMNLDRSATGSLSVPRYAPCRSIGIIVDGKGPSFTSWVLILVVLFDGVKKATRERGKGTKWRFQISSRWGNLTIISHGRFGRGVVKGAHIFK